jgi:predicted Zn-dependent protease with MMP-like domain
MTADGGMTPDVETWDEARVALGRVAELIQQKLGTYTEPLPDGRVTLAELQGVHNYHLIPEDLRHTLEDLILNIDELRVVKRVFEKLAMNHFYLEGGPGGLRMY